MNSDRVLDLLITDVGLPNGMNDRQLADAARGVRKDLNVLFITGYAENALLNHGHDGRLQQSGAGDDLNEVIAGFDGLLTAQPRCVQN